MKGLVRFRLQFALHAEAHRWIVRCIKSMQSVLQEIGASHVVIQPHQVQAL